MKGLTRRTWMTGAGAALAGLAGGASQAFEVHDKQGERLLVSLMCLRDKDLIADEAASYTPFQQFREQVLTLDLGQGLNQRTLLVSIWDREAGGVRVVIAALDRNGAEHERREFVMYPFLDLAATRIEPMRVPVMRVVDSGSDQLIEMDRLELHLTMKRVTRR